MQKAPAERAPKVEGKIHSGMKAIFFLKKIEKKNHEYATRKTEYKTTTKKNTYHQ